MDARDLRESAPALRRLEARSNEAPAAGALDGCAAIAMARGTHARLSSDDEDTEQDQENERARKSELATELDGFNLHAGVRIAADDDVGRERLCRYGARPPLALERLRRLPGGRVAYRIKYVRRGRAEHRVMTALECSRAWPGRRVVCPMGGKRARTRFTENLLMAPPLNDAMFAHQT